MIYLSGSLVKAQWVTMDVVGLGERLLFVGQGPLTPKYPKEGNDPFLINVPLKSYSHWRFTKSWVKTKNNLTNNILNSQRLLKAQNRSLGFWPS